MIRSWARSSFAVLAFLSPLSVAALARAEGKCGDTNCPKNWECKTETAVADIACAPDEPCKAAEPTTHEYCSPLSCKSDADCAADMVCYTETGVECADTPPCSGQGDCFVPADGGCMPTTRSACVPRYVPACETAADCGPGFTCETQEDCSCSGSTGGAGSAGSAGSEPSAGGGSDSKGGMAGGSAGSAGSGTPAPSDPGDPDAVPKVPSDAGAAPPEERVAPPECVCTPSKEKACKLTIKACATANDCASGWTCEDNPEGACWASSDGSSGCDTPDPAKICAPPYTDLVGGRGHSADGSGEGTAVGLGDPNSGSPTPPKGATDTGGTPASASGDDDSETAASDDSSSGCSVGQRGTSGGAELGFAAFAALALAGARRRRAR